MITVKELINELKKLPPDFTVASYTIFDFDPDNGYSVIGGYSEPYISVEVEKKLVKIEGDCDKKLIETKYACYRYTVARTKSGWYGAYDLQDSVFVGALFPAYDNPHAPHTNPARCDGYKKAQAFCDELNRKEQSND